MLARPAIRGEASLLAITSLTCRAAPTGASRACRHAAALTESPLVNADPAAARRFGAHDILMRSIGLFFSSFGSLFALAFVPALLVTLLGRWAEGSITGGAGPNLDPASSSLAFVSGPLVLAIVANLVVSAAASGLLCLAAMDAALGTRHGTGQYLAQTLRRILPLMLLPIVYAFAAGLASLLLIVPGLYVMARYAPLTPAIVFDDAGWSGLTRARDLTVNYRWPLVGLIVFVALLGILLTMAIGLGFTALPPVGGGVAFLFEVVATAVYFAYAAVLQALIYLRLRALNEGMTVADVAATID